MCQVPLVEALEPGESTQARTEFEERVINHFPYVLALPYRNMLDEQDGRGRLDLFAYTLQNALKYLGLLVVGEYHASDHRLPQLNMLFKHNLYQPSFGNWNQFLREGIAALDKDGHVWLLPEVKEGYAAVETARKAKKYPVETEYTDEAGQLARRTVEGTAIGTLINFRNRHLGHGTPLNKAQATQLYGQFKPILDDLLQGLSFSESLTMVRAERNEFYRLSGCSPELILGRKPDQQDQSKVWVEHDDGRKLEIMPFFILPGQVAGADPASGVLVYEQFTGGKRVMFHGPDNSHGESVGEVLELLKTMIRHKEEEPSIPTSKMGEEGFRARLEIWNDGIMEGLHREKKVIPDVYQPRADAEMILRGWTKAEAPLMVIAAEAGSGKTNLLAEMTRQYAEFGLPVVLMRAVLLKSSNFKSAIATVLNLYENWKMEELGVLNRPAEQPWMILVDGVNEHAQPEALFYNMLEFLTKAPRQGVKFILSWRVSNLKDLPSVEDKFRDLVYMAEQRDGDHVLARHSLRLKAMNREEIKSAWERYAGHSSKLYRPKFSFEDLVLADRVLTEQFSNPLLLRMFMELFNQRGLKQKPKGMADIWSLWWQDQQTREREAQFLEAFASLVTDSGESKVSLDALFDHDELSAEVRNIQVDSAYQQLLRRGVLSQSFVHGEIHVGFTMEAAMFFVLGELAGRRSWTSAGIASRIKDSPRWVGALQSMLRAQVGQGQLELLCDCIDNPEVPDEFSSIALAQAFLLKPADQVLDALLENPSKSDWAVMEHSLELLNQGLYVSVLKELSQPLVDRGLPQLPDSSDCLIAISEFVDSESLTMLGAKVSELLNQQWTDSGMVGLSRLVHRVLPPVDALNVIEQFPEDLQLYEINEVRSFVFAGVGRFRESIFFLEENLRFLQDETSSSSLLQAKMLEYIGDNLQELGDYSGASSRYNEALSIRTFVFGEVHHKVAWTISRIAECFLGLGDFSAALRNYEKVFSIENKLFGNGHPRVAATISNIGECLRKSGDYVGAISKHEEALSIERMIWGNEDRDVAGTICRIGHVLREQGDYAGSISRYEECLDIEKNALGESHPEVATTISLIGHVLREQGDYAGSISRYEECLDIRKNALGESHPKVATTISLIGHVLREQGDYAGSISRHEECLDIRKNALGESHPKVATTISLIGQVLREQGDYAGSISRHEECLDIRKNALGESHPKVATTISLIGQVLREQGDYAGSISRYEECLDIRKNALGESHPKVATTISLIGQVLREQGDYAGSISRYEECLEIQKNALGESHPEVATTISLIGQVLREQGDYAGSISRYEECLDIRKNALGESHPEVAKTILLIVLVLRKQGDYAGLISRYEEYLDIQKNALGESHPSIRNIENLIFFTTALWQPASISRNSLNKYESQVSEMTWKGADNMLWRLRLVDVLLIACSLGLDQAEQKLHLLEAEALDQDFKSHRFNEIRAVGEVLQSLRKQVHD